MSWEKIEGLASAIGTGKDQSIWIVGRSGKRVYKLDMANMTWQKISFDETGQNPALGVVAGGQGNPWVIAQSKEIFRYRPEEGDWVKFEGLASAIGLGKDKSTWIAGRSGKRVYKLDWANQTWEKISFDETGQNPVLGVIAGGKGNPWVITQNKEIYYYKDPDWIKFDGLASAIGIGLDRSTWIAGRSGKRVYKLNWKDQTWEKLSFDETGQNPVVGVAADAEGHPWVVTQSQEIFRYAA